MRRAVVALALALPALACPAPAGPQDSPLELRDRVLEHRLENGWRFLLLPRTDAPTVAFETWVACGAANDPAGASGLANLTKNLLFKGTDRLGSLDWEAEEPALEAVDAARAGLEEAEEAGDPAAVAAARGRLEAARARAAALVDSEAFSRALEDAGGGATLNAFVDQDGTRLVVSLPSNQLELWCWTESERFRRPVLREFHAELDALLEDGRARYVDDAYGRMDQAVRETAFGDHPLGRLAFGDLDQLGQLERADVREHLDRRYGARQCTTAVVGDFDPSELVPLLERYFGDLPAGPARPPGVPPVPGQDGERRVLVDGGGAPLLWIAWRVPPAGHPDEAAVELAVRLLGYARSSRLERRLLRDSALCSELDITPAWGGRRVAPLALLRCVPLLGVEVDAVEAAVHEEVARLAREGPTREELAGAKRVAAAEHYRSLRSNASVAEGLATGFGRGGDWRAWFSRDRRLAAVTAEDVRRALSTHLVPERRIVAILEPAGEAPAAAPREEAPR
jgi:predicted Zn-dependent peptidase